MCNVKTVYAECPDLRTAISVLMDVAVSDVPSWMKGFNLAWFRKFWEALTPTPNVGDVVQAVHGSGSTDGKRHFNFEQKGGESWLRWDHENGGAKILMNEEGVQLEIVHGVQTIAEEFAFERMVRAARSSCSTLLWEDESEDVLEMISRAPISTRKASNRDPWGRFALSGILPWRRGTFLTMGKIIERYDKPYFDGLMEKVLELPDVPSEPELARALAAPGENPMRFSVGAESPPEIEYLGIGDEVSLRFARKVHDCTGLLKIRGSGQAFVQALVDSGLRLTIG